MTLNLSKRGNKFLNKIYSKSHHELPCPRIACGISVIPFAKCHSPEVSRYHIISRAHRFESETQIKGCLLPALGFLEGACEVNHNR